VRTLYSRISLDTFLRGSYSSHIIDDFARNSLLRESEMKKRERYLRYVHESPNER
jgi:hypothetical protein